MERETMFTLTHKFINKCCILAWPCSGLGLESDCQTLFVGFVLVFLEVVACWLMHKNQALLSKYWLLKFLVVHWDFLDLL